MAVCYGCEGTLIWVYQTLLSAFGYYKDSMDGSFGKNMQKAVEVFQKDKGLKIDGFLGSDSVYTLFNLYKLKK